MSTKVWMKEVGRLIDGMGASYTMEKCRKHIKVHLVQGDRRGMVVIAASPSCSRSLLNVKSTLRKVLA